MTLPVWASRRVPALLVLAATLAGAERPQVGEYQLKAVFLFNFTKFVEWPAQASGDVPDPFSICVAGSNPFGGWLDDEVRGKTVGRRPISIRLVSDPREARKCQILFIPAAEHKRERALLDGLQGASVLTVGEEDDFTRNGGMVEFKQVNARIHIEIVPEAAERANLRISSKLLSLATLEKGPS